jgi:UDP-N-acetylmuramate: L-alanyl-gamma-D-glutamyl-meso-diaminopimelate ligase
MKVHILGVCGTFMAGVAQLAVQRGDEVLGVDQNVYPPMSTLLEELGVELIEGYENYQPQQQPDVVIVGNAISRGNPALEFVMSKRWRYTSGPQWLSECLLIYKKVIAVAGTHGKTTTTAMIIWLMKQLGFNPGYLVGGVVNGLTASADIGGSDWFVIEADEYDTAFFDKRSKFVHYYPEILIINNLEFDHADIFDSLEDILKQFHILLRTMPSNAYVIANDTDENIKRLFQKGQWSQLITFSGKEANWQAKPRVRDGSHFDVVKEDAVVSDVAWSLIGEHNVENSLAALAAVTTAGADSNEAIKTLREFKGVKRRLEKFDQVGDVVFYEDFAHHPTAIRKTLSGLKKHLKANQRLIVLMELASFTMRNDTHKNTLMAAFSDADNVSILKPNNCVWPIEEAAQASSNEIKIYDDASMLIDAAAKLITGDDVVVVMSNRDFADIYHVLPNKLRS